MSDLSLEDYIELLQGGNTAERRNAAWMLGRQRDPRIVDPLVAALDDPEVDVRLRVAEALGNLKDESVVDPLIAALENEGESPRVRAMLAGALGLQGDLRAIEPLLKHLDDSDEAVRAAVIDALYHLPDAQAITPLADMMTQDADANVRHAATRTLLQIGGAQTVDALLARLDGVDDPEGRMRIMEVLGGLYDQRAVEPLRAYTDDPDEGVRETARWALSKLRAD